MGANAARDFAEQGVDLTTALTWHLQSNHYPPVPVVLVRTCIEAIDFAIDDNWEDLVELPEGVTFKGQPVAPVWAIVENYHLDAWL